MIYCRFFMFSSRKFFARKSETISYFRSFFIQNISFLANSTLLYVKYKCFQTQYIPKNRYVTLNFGINRKHYKTSCLNRFKPNMFYKQRSKTFWHTLQGFHASSTKTQILCVRLSIIKKVSTIKLGAKGFSSI